MAFLLSAMLVVIGVLCYLSPLITGQVYIDKPSDTEVLINDSVTIRCRIANEPGAYVYWSAPGTDGNTIGPNGILHIGLPDRFSVVGDEQRGEYNLRISGVQSEDNGQYVCIVILEEGTGEQFRSDSTLRVVELSGSGDPVCWADGGRVTNIGDPLTLRCAASDPNISLTWFLGDEALDNEPLVIQSGVGTRVEMIAQPQINDQVFTCQPNNEMRAPCQISLQVKHPPIVLIEPVGLIETGKDARFMCTATGNPDNFAYTWYYGDYVIGFEEHPRFNRARLEESGSLLVLPGLTDIDNGVTLRCEAVNIMGATTATHIITAQIGRTLAQIIGPILLGVILGLVLVVLVIYFIWWRRQRSKVRQISKTNKKRNPPVESVVNTVDSGVVYTQTLGGFGSARYGKKTPSVNGDLPRSALDLESVGYGPDVTDVPAYGATSEDQADEDEGALRPIPRKKSTGSLSSVVVNGHLPSATAHDDDDDHELLNSPNEDKSYMYYVNPHFEDFRSGPGKAGNSASSAAENDLNPEPEEEKKIPPSYNFEYGADESNLDHDHGDNSMVISTEL